MGEVNYQLLHNIPTDLDMTCSSLLAASKTVEVGRLTTDVLDLPYTIREEFRQRYPNHDDYTRSCVNHYIEVSPRASWEHIAGRFLYNKEDIAFKEVKEHIKSHQGMQLVMWSMYNDNP